MVVKAGHALTEVVKWDVEDLFKVLATMEREQDYTKAYHTYIHHKAETKNT